MRFSWRNAQAELRLSHILWDWPSVFQKPPVQQQQQQAVHVLCGRALEAGSKIEEDLQRRPADRPSTRLCRRTQCPEWLPPVPTRARLQSITRQLVFFLTRTSSTGQTVSQAVIGRCEYSHLQIFQNVFISAHGTGSPRPVLVLFPLLLKLTTAATAGSVCPGKDAGPSAAKEGDQRITERLPVKTRRLCGYSTSIASLD